MAACPRASLWQATTSTLCSTWGSSLFTWRPLLREEEAPVQEGLVAAVTPSLCVTRLIRRPALRFVPSIRIPTMTLRFPFMEKQEKPLKTEKRLARSTTINATRCPAEGVRYHALLVISLGSQAHIPTTAFAVAESKSLRATSLLVYDQVRILRMSSCRKHWNKENLSLCASPSSFKRSCLSFDTSPLLRVQNQLSTFEKDNLVLSTELIMWIGQRKEIRKLTFRALARLRSESRNCGLCVDYIQKDGATLLVAAWV